jgi:hypothetical protein
MWLRHGDSSEIQMTGHSPPLEAATIRLVKTVTEILIYVYNINL